MAALTEGRPTPRRDDGNTWHGDAAANTKIYQGALVVNNASGYTAQGTTATDLIALGVALEEVDNTGGANGAKKVPYRKGTWLFKNDGTHTCDRTHIGKTVYIVDDQTVASTDGTGTRSAAGVCRDVDAQGVWVEIS